MQTTLFERYRLWFSTARALLSGSHRHVLCCGVLYLKRIVVFIMRNTTFPVNLIRVLLWYFMEDLESLIYNWYMSQFYSVQFKVRHGRH